MRSALPLVALACAVSLLLSGCVPEDPVVVPPAEQTVEPMFATDEEALAAATDAYKAYLEMSDLIAQEGGKDPERIAPYVTNSALEDQTSQFSPFQESSLRTVGATAFDGMKLQQFSELQPGRAEVVTYVCLDVSAVQVINSSGKDVTPQSRDNRLPLEVEFENQGQRGKLLVSRSETWPGSDFC